MLSGSIKNLFPLLLCGFLAACTGGGTKWPTLSEPLPDPAARTTPLHTTKPAAKPAGASAHAEPAAPTVPTDESAPKTAEEAETLLSTIKTDLQADTLSYRKAVSKIDDTPAESRLDAWYDAQAALTALSQTASRLDKLIGTAFETVAEAAETQAGVIENFVVSERARLAGLKP